MSQLPGWKPYAVKPKTLGSTDKRSDFGRGFALSLGHGASQLLEVRLRSGGTTTDVDRSDLFDGNVIVCPGGFEEVEWTWAGDVVPGLSRFYFEVLLRPAAVLAGGADLGMLAARRVYPSTLHAAASISVSAPNGFSLVCDAPGDLWQQGDNTGSGLATSYLSNKVGDERAPWRPTPSIFFDGFVAGAQHANFEVWIFAYNFLADGTPDLSFYRVLTGGAISSIPAGAPATSPSIGGQHVCRLAETTGIGMLIPPDGFQLWVKNTDAAVALTVRGFIGGRSR